MNISEISESNGNCLTEYQDNKKIAKIAMISMFKNESKVIGNMLESVAPYISYWIIQDNGSTDGTPEVVKKWYEKYKIPGFMYKVEEGWVGFGWNRDHVLQKLKQQDHGCDWIMKMDCDETLQIDEGMDWSIFQQTNIQSFNVHAYSPGCQYFRTWIWNAKLNWSFNHDPAHETIVLDGTEQFQRHMLDLKFKMLVGSTMGESYQCPTKYVSDALKLEEKLIREGTMLKDLYHFWYVGKSYEDGYPCKELPLGVEHQKEMARRCVWYFEEVLNVTHTGFKKTRTAVQMDEMGYYAMNVMGGACRFLGEHYKAIEYYKGAEQFCPVKNDHLVHLAELYWELMDYKKMLEVTTMLINPSRKNPFPNYMLFITQSHYVDTGNKPEYLHREALRLNNEITPIGSILRINNSQQKKIFIIDNFYDSPYSVIDYAVKQEFFMFSKWKRTTNGFLTPQIKQKFEQIMGEKIINWEQHNGSMNGIFQYCTSEDSIVYNHDSQKWAAIIFLTPDAVVQTKTSLYQDKTGINFSKNINIHHDDLYDSTKFELIDTVSNVFNRCFIFDARSIHAATTEYFANTVKNDRLFQMFFFD